MEGQFLMGFGISKVMFPLDSNDYNLFANDIKYMIDRILLAFCLIICPYNSWKIIKRGMKISQRKIRAR